MPSKGTFSFTEKRRIQTEMFCLLLRFFDEQRSHVVSINVSHLMQGKIKPTNLTITAQ